MSIARKLMQSPDAGKRRRGASTAAAIEGSSAGTGRAPRALFVVDQLAEDAPKVRQRRVGSDREQLEVGIGVEHLLLAFDDALVLEKAFDQALMQRLRDPVLVTLEVVQV